MGEVSLMNSAVMFLEGCAFFKMVKALHLQLLFMHLLGSFQSK